MTASAGAIVSTVADINRTENEDIWEVIVTFTLVSGDTTGAAAVPINGLLQKIIVKLGDMADAEGTTDVSLTDNGDNTIWSVTDLPESVTYVYSVLEPLSDEVNIVLGFTNPGSAGATVVVTLRGI